MSHTQHYVVRSVLLSQHGAAALTLEPVEWFRENPDNMVDDGEGELIPDLASCDPAEATEVTKVGGKMTELRFESDPGLRPGDYVTATIVKTSTPAEFAEFA